MQQPQVRFHLWPFAACHSPSLCPVSCPLFSCPAYKGTKAQKKYRKRNMQKLGSQTNREHHKPFGQTGRHIRKWPTWLMAGSGLCSSPFQLLGLHSRKVTNRCQACCPTIDPSGTKLHTVQTFSQGT